MGRYEYLAMNRGSYGEVPGSVGSHPEAKK